jgi:DNA-binding SARP family transcriptional activator
VAIIKMAKVTNPTLLNVLPRRRLFNLLDRMRRRPVIWIAGPAGSGKTTLVSSYLGARKLPCLWYQLDEDDSDPATFFYYLGQAAKKAAPRKQKPLLLLTPEYRQGIPIFTRRYFENLYERLRIPSALVFDNYQDVPEGSPFHEIILQGLSATPGGLNIILISRKDPPPVFIRLQASQSMEILGWNKLRLTLEEAAGIVRLRSRLRWPRDWLNHLYQMTDGWAAGLVLMVENAKREGIEPQEAGRFTPEEIFRYFSIEIFDKTDEDMQNFLLKTAFLPKMTARMAQQLTGLTSSARLLSSLSRDNYFTLKSFQNEPIYQYHPLFRDFLSGRAREIFPPGSLSILLGRAAAILEEAGQVEDAVFLLQEVGDWDALVRVILKHASSMGDQGRYRPLEDWLSRLPMEIMENHPWLLQWMGTCRLPFDPPQSQPYFEKAFERFKASNEANGIIVALWSIVESIRISGGDLKQLDLWISVLEELSLRFKSFPSPESELRFVSMMIGALIYRQPQHPEIQKWTERAFSLAQGSPSMDLMDLKLEILSHLNMFYNLTGDFEKAIAIIDALKNMSQARNVRPIVLLWVKRAESIHYRCTVQHEKCLKAVSDGLELSRSTGIHVIDHFLLTQGISSALNMNDFQRAESWLEKEALSYPVLGSWHRSLYHLQKARLALLREDLSQAMFHADLALTLSVEAGSPYTLGFSHIVNSLVKHVLGKHQEAKDHVGQVFDIALKIKAKIYEFSALLLEALFAFDQGEEESGRSSLRKALALGKEKKYFYPYIDLPGRVAYLCTKALENGIEVEYVQEFIRRLNIVSDQPPLHLENWPWPLRIYTLGRFELLRDGKPIQFSRKAQQKPLSLVKALVALGGMEVKEEQITDILWPEADGDAAHRSFEITLYRLRKLIGIHDAVQLQEGRLTLDPRYCWIDVWAFDHFLGQSEPALQKEGMKTGETGAIYQIQKAIDLYQGVFLPGETSESWANSLRERIRSRFLRCVKKLGHYWERAGQLEKAVECFQKGLEIDDLIEEFYRSLMGLFQQMGRRTDALSVYQRCKKALSIALGVDPSPEIQAIRQSLLADKKS